MGMDMDMDWGLGNDRRPPTGEQGKSDAEYTIRMHRALDIGYWMRGTGSSVQGFGFLLSGRASRGGDNNTCATTAVAAKISGQCIGLGLVAMVGFEAGLGLGFDLDLDLESADKRQRAS
ncbi:GM19039 [Drosophila sechellia]|uniref:GM19039 n=1 Tax=Drosophila sechellia TaxID=7238 RepID=B4HX45_DROSE|nr:GM19039 [Drosophila sechellia]